MKLKPEELYKIIKANEYKSVRFYEGSIKENLTDNMCFESIFRPNTDSVIKRIKELEGILTGCFTLALGNGSKNQKVIHCKRLEVEFYRTTIIQPKNSQTFESTEFIDQRVNELVLKKINEIEQEKKYEELESKLAELETWGGKLNHLLTNFLNTYLEGMQNSVLQGAELEPEVNETELNELENSLALVVRFLGKENIIKLGKKIRTGQANSVKPIIITFINS